MIIFINILITLSLSQSSYHRTLRNLSIRHHFDLFLESYQSKLLMISLKLRVLTPPLSPPLLCSHSHPYRRSQKPLSISLFKRLSFDPLQLQQTQCNQQYLTKMFILSYTPSISTTSIIFCTSSSAYSSSMNFLYASSISSLVSIPSPF